MQQQRGLQSVAMLVLVRLLTVMFMIKSGAALTKVINAQSGQAVLLTLDWKGLEHRQVDVRWTHQHLVMSLKKNNLQCHHGRCQLLGNGSLSFSHVQAEDSGNYCMEVFAENGNLLNKTSFLLNVQGSSSSSSSSTVAALMSVLVCCFILVIIFIFIKRRKSQNTSATTGPSQENIYVVMHGDRGNRKKGEKEEEKKQEKEKQEEESHYVSCNAVVSLETPITLPVDAEDIYV